MTPLAALPTQLTESLPRLALIFPWLFNCILTQPCALCQYHENIFHSCGTALDVPAMHSGPGFERLASSRQSLPMCGRLCSGRTSLLRRLTYSIVGLHQGYTHSSGL
jgi:hypothetical protein